MNAVRECADHDGCTVVESPGFPQRPGSWRSHAPADLDPAVRLNPDEPEADDRRPGKAKGAKVRWRAARPDEQRRLGQTPEEAAGLVAYARARGLTP